MSNPHDYDEDPFFHDPSMFYNPFSPFGGYLTVEIPSWNHQGGSSDDMYPLNIEATVALMIDNLKQVYDPEIPINVYDIGLIYDVQCTEDGGAYIRMTLTTPNCPSAQELPEVVRLGGLAVPGIKTVDLDLTFSPPWTPEMMSEDAKLVMTAEYGIDMDQML